MPDLYGGVNLVVSGGALAFCLAVSANHGWLTA
jgi:hypothetical protein